MAGTASNTKLLSLTGSAERQLIAEFNKSVTDIETLRAQVASIGTTVNAMITAAATNIAAVAAVTPLTLTSVNAADDMTAAVVKDLSGTTL